MITIRITNVEELVESQQGWLAAHVGGLVVDLEAKVEETVVEKIKEALAANHVRAVVERHPGPG